MQDSFIAAIHTKNKLRIAFASNEDWGAQLLRTCAPMDFGPSRRTADKSDRYHFWDYDSDTKSHTLSLVPTQVTSIEVLPEQFDPSEFITWNTKTSPWFVTRDWGSFS